MPETCLRLECRSQSRMMPHMWNRSERIRGNFCFGLVFNFVFDFFLSEKYILSTNDLQPRPKENISTVSKPPSRLHFGNVFPFPALYNIQKYYQILTQICRTPLDFLKNILVIDPSCQIVLGKKYVWIKRKLNEHFSDVYVLKFWAQWTETEMYREIIKPYFF